MSAVPTAPEVRDPVVVDGIKYRIRAIEDGVARCRMSFGAGVPVAMRATEVRVDALVYDRVAGVWRVAA